MPHFNVKHCHCPLVKQCRVQFHAKYHANLNIHAHLATATATHQQHRIVILSNGDKV